MAPPTTTADLERLLSHSSWLRALARSLVRDAEQADDLVQETWLAALERGPSEERSMRAWLAAVARNFAHQTRRGEGRRAAREDARRVPDAQESTFDVVARASGQRELVEAVLELEEPYRSTILLRFFDGLPPRAIAQRCGVPVATVKTRLARGLDRLRRRLEETRGGERGAWLAVVLPLAGDPGGHGTWLGVWLVETKLKLALAGAVAAGALGGLVALRAADGPGAVEPPAEESPAIVQAAAPEAPRPSAPLPVEQRTRESVAASAAPPRASVVRGLAEPTSEERVHGFVFDAEGLPLPGVELVLVPEEEPAPQPPEGDASAEDETPPSAPATTRSGAGGRFEAVAPARAGTVLAEASRATVLGGRFRAAADPPPTVVVVAPRAPLAGRVTDEAGAPVADCAVEWLLPDGFRARFETVLDETTRRPVATKSDAQGFFELADAASVRDARLSARAEGFEPWIEAAPELADARVSIVLRRVDEGGRALFGRVVDAAGEPVEAAEVALGMDATRTDALGRFAFDLEAEDSHSARFGVPQDKLVAVKRGYLPAEREAPAHGAQGEPLWPHEVVLRLGAEPLAIEGRVLHLDGSPAAGLPVWIADPSFLGLVDGQVTMVEGLLAGAGGEQWHRVETDADGRFRIEGLVERAYRVEAMDVSTLLRVSAEVAAGARGVELVLPEDQLIERVAGRVVSRRGEPVAGARVFPMCDAFRMRRGETTIGTRHATVEGTTTDAEGRFELFRVPKSLVYLRVGGDAILPVEYGRHHEGGIVDLAGGRMTELEIEAPLRCHAKVELPEDHPADAVAVLDEAGERLVMSIIEATSRRETDAIELSAGRTPSFAVTDAAATLVLLRGAEELERIPLELVPGELNVVRP